MRTLRTHLAFVALALVLSPAALAQSRDCFDNTLSRLDQAVGNITRQVAADTGDALAKWPKFQEKLKATETPEEIGGPGSTRALVSALDAWSKMKSADGSDLYYKWTFDQITRTHFAKCSDLDLVCLGKKKRYEEGDFVTPLAEMDRSTGVMILYPGFFKLPLMEQITTLFHEASHRAEPVYAVDHLTCRVPGWDGKKRHRGCDAKLTGAFGSGSFNAEFHLLDKLITDSNAPAFYKNQARLQAREMMETRFNSVTQKQRCAWELRLGLDQTVACL